MRVEPFWIVFCPTGTEPSHKMHSTQADAEHHAEMLCRSARSAVFYVMQAVAAAHPVMHAEVTQILKSDSAEVDRP